MIAEELIVPKENHPLQEPEVNLIPAVVRSEVNFLQLPFFSLSYKGLKDKAKTEYRIVTERNGEKVELLWRVSANAVYGYPTPFDRRVSRAIDALINETLEQHGYPLGDAPLQFSLYHLAFLMGVGFRNGRLYKDIKESLKRITLTGVESKGSFFLKDEQRWLEDTFHLYDRVVFKGEQRKDGAVAETNFLWLSEECRRSINAQYVKPLDYRYLASLKSDIASRLYELLGVKFYGLPPQQRYLRIGYLNLCHAMPLTPQQYYSNARKALDPAHKELIETGFLEKVTYQRYKGKKDFNIVYYLGERARHEKRGRFAKELPMEEHLLLSSADGETDGDAAQISELGKALCERGVSKSAAMQLSQKYHEDHIREKMEWFDSLVSIQSEVVSKNPAGWLLRAVEEDWQPTDEQRKAQEKRAQAHTEEDRGARWTHHRAERIEQELKDWDKTPPEARINGIFNFWLNTIYRGDPDSEEVRAKKQQYIDGLPKTEVERRRHIGKQYPIEPPEDFE